VCVKFWHVAGKWICHLVKKNSQVRNHDLLWDLRVSQWCWWTFQSSEIWCQHFRIEWCLDYPGGSECSLTTFVILESRLLLTLLLSHVRYVEIPWTLLLHHESQHTLRAVKSYTQHTRSKSLPTTTQRMRDSIIFVELYTTSCPNSNNGFM
jgi:hypothetical protein